MRRYLAITAVVLIVLGFMMYYTGVYLIGRQSLNGYLITYDGSNLTKRLWSRMSDYGVNDESVNMYVSWLKEVISGDISSFMNGKYIYWFFSDDSKECSCSMSKIVRIGLVNLSYGALMIVSSYRCGDSVSIVIHATIGDDRLWRELLAKALMLTFRLKYEDKLEALKITLFRKYRYLFNKPAWTIWKISLRGNGSKIRLLSGETLPIRNVFVVLEMPIYFITPSMNETRYVLILPHYIDVAELLYWRFIASPALTLAIKLSQPPNSSLLQLYKGITLKLVSKVVLRNVRYSMEFPNLTYTAYTPFLLRQEGKGPCIVQSTASSIFASIALDTITANAVINLPNGTHVISLLILPSTLFKSEGEVTLPVDVDGDGINDSAIVIVDTANLPIKYVETHIKELHLLGPLSYAPTLLLPTQLDNLSLSITTLFYAYFNYSRELLGSPSWMYLPWSRRTLRMHEVLIDNLIDNSLNGILSSWYVSAKTPSGYIHYWSTPTLNISKKPYMLLQNYSETVMSGKFSKEVVRFGPNSLNLWVNLWIDALNHTIPSNIHIPPSKSIWPKNVPKINVNASINTLPKILETPLNCAYSTLKAPLMLKCDVSFVNGKEVLKCMSRDINVLINGLPYMDQWNASILVRINHLSNLSNGNVICMQIMPNYGFMYSSYVALKRYWIGPALLKKKSKNEVLIHVPRVHFGLRREPKLILVKIPYIDKEIALIPINESAREVPLEFNVTLRANLISINNLRGWYVEESIIREGINASVKFLLTKGLVQGKVIALLDVCFHGFMPKELTVMAAVINVGFRNGTLIKLYEPIQVYRYATHRYTCYVVSHEVPEALMLGGIYEVYLKSLNTTVRVFMES